MSGDLVEATFSEWLQAQRLMLAAWRLQNTHIPGDLDPFVTYLEESLDAFQPSDYESAPVLFLSLLLNLEAGDLRRYGDPELFAMMHGRVARALDNITRPFKHPARPSGIRASRMVADAMLSSTAHPRAIATLGMSTIRPAWRSCASDPSLKQALGQTLPVFRSSRTTRAKIDALAQLALVGRRLPRWRQVEFYVLNSFFLWPLLVSSLAPDAGMGFAYPFGVDVAYDGHREVRVESHPMCRLDDFVPSFAKALVAAKKLWRSQNGKASREWKQRIYGASVAVDSSVAGALMAPFNLQTHFDGPSFEIYLALAVLARFVGIPNLPPIAATGSLGDPFDRYSERRQNDEEHTDIDSHDADVSDTQRWWQRSQRPDPTLDGPLNYTLTYPDGVPSKLLWARTSGQFDRIILPTLPAAEPADTERDAAEPELAPYVAQYPVLGEYMKNAKAVGEIVSCYHLQKAADAALTGSWRRHRFVRCPDVAWVEREAPPVNVRDPKIERVLELLKRNKERVRRLPPDIRLGSLVLALRHLNTNGRPEHLSMRSFLFFRMVDDERRARFLTTLWKAMGASDATLHEIINATSLKEAVRILADSLNRLTPPLDALSPTDQNPVHAAPDVLVLIEPTEIKPPPRIEFEDDTLLFDRVFGPELSRRLNPIAASAWRNLLGKTRVLIVKDAAVDDLLPKPTREPRSDEDSTLAALATFRHGFTQNMASAMLTAPEADASLLPAPLPDRVYVRGWLHRLRRARFIHQCSEQYFLSKTSRAAYLDRQPLLLRAVAHDRAARACAPYLSRVRLPGLVEFEARLPDAVHEAQFHLSRAIDLIEGEHRDDDRDAHSLWQRNTTRWLNIGRLSCSYQMKCWDLVRFAATTLKFPAIEDPIRIALELAEERGQKNLLPFELVSTVRLIDRYIENLPPKSLSAMADELGELRQIAKDWSQRAFSLSRWKIGHRRTAEAIFIMTHLAIVAMKPDGLNVLDARQAQIINKRALKMITNDPALAEVPIADWFVRYAATVEDPKKAQSIYRFGRRGRAKNAPFLKGNIALWIEALGISEAGSDAEKQLLGELNAIREKPDHFSRFHQRVLSTRINSRRWQSGQQKYFHWYEARPEQHPPTT
jgi:hypothetical protein